jgi:hypothetical protein
MQVLAGQAEESSSYRAYLGFPTTPPAGSWAVEKCDEPSWTGH